MRAFESKPRLISLERSALQSLVSKGKQVCSVTVRKSPGRVAPRARAVPAVSVCASLGQREKSAGYGKFMLRGGEAVEMIVSIRCG
jgi:hypothetical protein